jgi:hypothetical protein
MITYFWREVDLYISNDIEPMLYGRKEFIFFRTARTEKYIVKNNAWPYLHTGPN